MPIEINDPAGVTGGTGHSEAFITISTPVGPVTILVNNFIPFSVVYAPNGNTPGFTLGTTPGTVALPEDGMYEITY